MHDEKRHRNDDPDGQNRKKDSFQDVERSFRIHYRFFPFCCGTRAADSPVRA